MCLAVPGKIISISTDSAFTMADVDFNGVRRQVCVDTVEGARPGDYIVAHAGVAISIMDYETAQGAIADLEAMARFREEQS